MSQTPAPQPVLLLTSRVGMGGAERHAISLANRLGPGFRVVLAYLKREEDVIGQVDRAVVAELRCLEAARFLDLGAARRLAALAEAHGARLVVCANMYALFYAHLARLYARSPLTVMEIFHTTKLRTVKEHFFLNFYRPFFWAAHHLVYVCDGQRRFWSRRGLWARQVHMIYNGVDLPHFDPAAAAPGAAATRASLGFGPADRVVGICAVLRPEKAHVDLLGAVARLGRDGRRWKVLVIGDGPMRAVIEAEVARLGLEDDVRITGFQSDVRPWVAACDVLALASTAIETFSIAALEAMAMEKPMIMSDIGGAREQVEPGVNGLLFPAGDVPALAACLGECWDPAATRRMGAAARQRVAKDFSLDTMIEQYAALFRRAVGAPAAERR